MCFYIKIEDLAANALIEMLKKNQGRFVSYDDLRAYGTKVVELLSEQGEKAVLIMSREDTSTLLRDYTDFFEEREVNSRIGLYLKDEKTTTDLVQQFRGYLAFDVLLALMSKTSLQALGV